jgi:hypothetical protein
MYLDEKEFSQFLVLAKQKTYAGGMAARQGLRSNAHIVEFSEGDFLYVDTYFGGFHFIGEEVVSHEGHPIWGMNYYGKMLVDEIPDGFNQCLRQALLRVSREAPFRGPEIYRCSSMVYTCNWSGKVKGFEGYEIISLNGTDIYKLLFHGGELVD